MQKLLLITVTGEMNPIEFKNHIVYKVQHYNTNLLSPKHPEITGNVEALSEDTIRIRAEGEESDLEFVLEQAKIGPILSHIQQVHHEWKPAGNKYKIFGIKRA